MLSSLILAPILSAAAWLSPALPFTPPAQEDLRNLAVDVLHIGNGEVLENVLIQIEGGKIVAITPDAEIPSDAIRVEGAHLTPGLIDAFSYMAVGQNTVEESRETTASASLADSIRLSDPSFQRALSEGVTASFLTPDSLNVFGGLATVVKTAGGQPADLYAAAGSAARILTPVAALKISLGNDVSSGNHAPWGRPSGFFTRRPTTRMGAVWAIRRDFHRASTYYEKLAAGEIEADADLEVLAKVLRGDIPLRVQARRNNDIQTVLRLAKEFGWKDVTIEEATEAFRCADLLAASGIKVVAGPAYDAMSRAIANGPSLPELRLAADPPPVCCENLHEDMFLTDWESGGPVYPVTHSETDACTADCQEIERNKFGMAVDPNYPVGEGHDHPEEAAATSGLGRDLALLLGTPRYAAGLFRGRMSEGDQATPALAALLANAGVPTALGAAEAHDQSLTESSLIHQARRAVQYGLSRSDALVMVTSRAAEFCGLADRIGLAKVGYDADLVLWSGDPLDATSRPLLILVDGQVMLDIRN